jgi:hypothetical protein
VGIDGLLVKRVDNGGLGGAAVSADRVGDLLERCECPSSEMNTSALVRERLRNRATNRPTAAIDDGVPSFEQHEVSFRGLA